MPSPTTTAVTGKTDISIVKFAISTAGGHTLSAGSDFYVLAVNDTGGTGLFGAYLDYRRPGCGNSVKASTEACDDGNLVDGDGCSSVCEVESGFSCTESAAGLSSCGCASDSACGSNAYCAQGTPNTCVAKVADGTAIPAQHGVCGGSGTLGSAATACTSGQCSVSTNTCGAVPTTACTNSSQCASGVCQGGTCTDTITLRTTTGTSQYTAGAAGVTVDPDLAISGSTTMTGAHVTITSGYVNGHDRLDFNNTGTITGSWNAATGRLTLSGSDTVANYQAALRTVTYRTLVPNPAPGNRVLTFRVFLGSKTALASTGHYYEEISAPGLTWAQAQSAAAARRYHGLQGYLVTITSAAEQTYADSLSGMPTWIGLQANPLTTLPRTFRWATGPDANTDVCTHASGTTCTPVAGAYSNWYAGEPNNGLGSGQGCVQMYADGTWDDVDCATGVKDYYVVEYGDMAGDPVHTGTRTVNVNYSPLVVDSAAGTTNFNAGGATAVTVDANVNVTGTATLTGASVTISEGFVAADDVLTFSSLHGITGSYDATKGILSLSGTATTAQYRDVFRTVAYRNTNASTAAGLRKITFGLGTAKAFSNGHFYEYVALAGSTWDQAKANADTRSYLGIQGYLATITSLSENDFIRGKLSTDGWMGARARSFSYPRNWYWATGPESNTDFCSNTANGTCTAINGAFSNFNPGQPDNWTNNGALPGEDRGQIYFVSAGKWNDLAPSDTLAGYVIEYGGMAADDPAIILSDTRDVQVRAATSLAVTSSLNPSRWTQAVTLTATVTPSAATGTVQFSVDGTPVGSAVTVASGTATLSLSNLAVGTRAVTAAYAGDTTRAPSNGTLSGGQVVNPALNGNGTCTGANAAVNCASGACGSDSVCGYLNDEGSCTSANASTVCRGGVCGSDGKCGHKNGEGSCTGGTATTVCRGAACATSLKCTVPSGCAVDSDCTGGQRCDTSSFTCSSSVTVTASDTALSSGEAVTVTFTFSEAPVGFAAEDITAQGGNLTGLAVSQADNKVYTATFTQSGSTAASVTVADSSYTNASGAAGKSGTLSFTTDLVAPTVAVTSSDALLSAGEAVTLTFTVSEAPVGFESADVSVTGGTLSQFASTANPRVFTATFTQSGTGASSATVAAGSFADAAGNAGSPGTLNLSSDLVAPSVAITASDKVLSSGERVTLTFTFTEAPQGFAAGDVTVQGGTLSAFVATGPTTWTASFTQSGVAPASVEIAAGSYQDQAGNAGAGDALTFTTDTGAPTVTVSASDSQLSVGEAVTVTFTFSEAVQDFDDADIAATGGAVTGLASTADPKVMTATFTQQGAQAPTVTVGAGGYSDAAGNAGLGDTLTMVLDDAAPTVTLTSADTLLADGETVTVTLTFSEAPVGLTLSDLTATGGAFSSLASTTNGRVYTASFTQQGTGATAELTLAANLYADEAGNLGSGASLTFTTDLVAPTVALAASDTVLSVNEAVTVTFTFSEAPVGFAAEDITAQGGNLTGLAVTADPKVYTATLTQSGGGTPSVTVKPGSYTDAAENPGVTQTLTLAADVVAPTLALTTSDALLSAGEPVTVTFTFSEEPAGFDAADITLTGGQLTGLSVSTTDAKVYTATFTQAGTDPASVAVSSGSWADAAGNAGGGDALGMALDLVPPVLDVQGTDLLLAVDPPEYITVTFAFSEAPVGFAAADVAVTGGVLSDFTVTADPRVYTATFTQSGMDAPSVTVAAGTWTDTAGNAGVLGSLTMTTDPDVPLVAVKANGLLLAAGETVTVTFQFTEPPAGFSDEDVVVTGGLAG
ncbi:MAG: Ig-like domain repeat protein, partial [Deltaproteobacteria bacterium]|nr:Ig-like domain repeat protein [Deltaproteobacteria bacterium]